MDNQPPNNDDNVGTMPSLFLNDGNVTGEHVFRKAMPRCHTRHQASRSRRNAHRYTHSMQMDRLDQPMLQGQEVIALP